MPGEPDNATAASYRVQWTGEFDFRRAAELAGYLADLGVSDLYGSPCLQAAEGSTHGYDVLDHGRVSEALGGEAGWRQLCDRLAGRGLGLILDIVPNHVCITGDNPLWRDVLENGRAGRYAHFFDVDWDVPDPWLAGKVLLPVLHDRYDAVLRSGELKMERGAGVPPAKTANCGNANGAAGWRQNGLATRGQDAHVTASRCPALALAYRGQRFPLSGPSVAGLARLAGADLDQALARVSADPDRLDTVLEEQHYRLADWRTSGTSINYRRFFTINSLAGLRVEDPQVFGHVHARVLEWVRQGSVTGLRVDHIDGLREPGAYLERLRAAAPDARIVVEKILASDERLPESWPVEGTTGYDFLNVAGGLFVDPAGEEPLTRLYAEFTGEPTDYGEIVRWKKRQVLEASFGGELDRLVSTLLEVCRARRLRDFVRAELRGAVAELISVFPVYRTYVNAESGQAGPSDGACIREALAAACGRRGDLDTRIWDLLSDVLLLRRRGRAEDDFAMRFQQLTGPVMAKGVEDAAFYSFNRLVSLNEVGGDPGRFGRSVEDFHRFCQHLQQHWPLTMLATATHDAKRGEDVRLRIGLLSEIPREWSETVRRWSRMAERHRRGDMPSRNAEYLLYQTLVGAWPITKERLVAYMVKAAREEKAHTTWERPDAAYERALEGLVVGLLRDASFVADLGSFAARLAPAARVSSLSQTLLKCTAPGVPDFYQGTELWDLNLVDPDNRRPVDYAVRRRLLKEAKGLRPEEALTRMDEALPKLVVIRRALGVRRHRPALFGSGGDYQPLYARGERADHVVSFVRGQGAATIVPRFLLGLAGQWGDTAVDMPPGDWRNEFTGEVVGGSVRLSDLLGRFPVALLTLQGGRS